MVEAGIEIQRSLFQIQVRGMRGKVKTLTALIRTIPHHSLCTWLKCLTLSDVKTSSIHDTVVECSTRNPEVPSSNPRAGRRKTLTGPIRKIPPPIPQQLINIPVIIWSENQKSPWYTGTVKDMRSRGTKCKFCCGQKGKLSQVQLEQYHNQSLCTTVKYLKLSDMKTRSLHGTVVDCRTREPQVPA